MVGPHSGCRFLGQASGGVHAVRACCVPGTMLGAGDTSMSKAVKISVLVASSLVGGNREKKACREIY